MAKQLTAAAVERLRPSKRRCEIPDGGCAGLYLIIQPSGAKSWALRFRRPNGAPAKLTLGKVDLTNNESDSEPVIGAPLTLASARRLATELHHQRARGKDVVAARHRAKLEREARGEKTFGRTAIDFIEQHAKRRNRRWEEQARLLGVRAADDGVLELIPKGLADRWRDREIADISGDDIHLMVDECRERGVPGLERRAEGPSESQALRMYAALSKMFKWLVKRRRISASPVVGVARPHTPRSRDHVLSNAEIVAYWRAAEAERKEVAAVLKLLLLLGQRLGEVRGMRRRSELSDDGAVWTIPGERTKNRRTHVVPMPPLVRGILASVPNSGDLVFTTDGSAAITIGSKIKSRLDHAMKISGWRLHDIRRSCATGMAEIGIAPHIVEAVLNHVSGHKAGVAGVYNRALYAAEKKAALERWAAHIEGLISGKPAKVVPLHRAEA
jgi:integrase